MNAFIHAYLAIRRDWRRLQNRRRRAQQRVAGFPMADSRDWSGRFLDDLKAVRRS